ncbi:MAG TPA: squalene--hopene cyclase, partial [Acidimicrobiales bacterium]|nr:squalene--hopene cyclase [Acidimicrobiales bacterium]
MTSTTIPADQRELVQQALDRGVRRLLAEQHPDGWWKGELATNVTMDAEDLLMREFLGVRDEAETSRTASWIRSQQRADGSWATFYGGPPDVSTTVEAYLALRLAGDAVEADHMARAATLVRELGGVPATRVFTRLWLALFGLWSWDDLPALPPEVVLLPPWCPLNIYDFACWARQTIVALTVVASHRPVRTLPFRLHELGVAQPDMRRGGGRPSRAGLILDSALRAYERRPVGALRRLALARAERWIVRHQERDGSWGGIQPPWVYSLMALHLLGYSAGHPVMQKGLAGLDAFTVRDHYGRRMEACQSPVWDTALAIVALTDAGLPTDHPSLVRAADWLLAHEVRTRGDWAVRRPRLDPGGWAFEFANEMYPDVDDTAVVVLALRRVRHPDPARVEEAVERARAWTLGMQGTGGGWGAFDADNTREICRRLPFCDFGEVIDPPTADVTAHAVEMLAGEGLGEDARVVDGTRWLLAQQEVGGSWFGRWGANHVYGTGACVPALVAAGMSVDEPALRRAARWLESHQHETGGWGEDLRSYDEGSWRGRGEPTASQTAWALLALLALRRGPGAWEATERGAAWLTRTQQADGTWDEPWFTGTGFPGDFY